jgi:hypothetical protein
MKTNMSSIILVVVAGLVLTTAVNAQKDSSATDPPREGPAFSSLSVSQCRKIETRLAPPPTAQRNSPYSTPMYYLLHQGYRDGVGAMDPIPAGNLILDRNRPDWQEVILRDWVELGLTSTLYLTTPQDWSNPYAIQAIEDYFAISKKLGLRIAIRLGGDRTLQGIEGSGWALHPQNTQNRIEEYVKWVAKVATACAGKVDYYIVGDEVNSNSWEEPIGNGKTRRGVKAPLDRSWTPQVYMEVFTQIAKTIKAADPQAKVSMFGMGGADWPYVKSLLDLGYAEYGDAVAANIFQNESTEKIQSFVQNVTTAAPHFKFYSNGVGYVPARDTNFYPVNPYKTLYDDIEQAHIIAKVMIQGFDAGWDALPYYIIVRQWILPDGSNAPHWYGFFGFEDLVIDEFDNLTVKRYPGWYAFQTVAHTFYDRDKFTAPNFRVTSSEELSMFRVYQHQLSKSPNNDSELIIIAWNDSETTQTTIEIDTTRYKYPTQISLFNYNKCTDIPYTVTDGKTKMKLSVSSEPMIIRLLDLSY